jgi:ankyrin repeat protein
MTNKYTNINLDNSLFIEINKKSPSDEKIRNLVRKGANINALDCENENLLYHALCNICDTSSVNLIRLLIELGINLNYAQDNCFNCLSMAFHKGNISVIEMLLKAGANPNCIIHELDLSLLDLAELDVLYEETQENDEDVEFMKDVIELLKKHGAKSSSEIIAKCPATYLNIAAYYETGIYTETGHLYIENIPNISTSLITNFKNWLANYPNTPETYIDEKGRYKKHPNNDLVNNHNIEGKKLAKQIKKLVGNDILVCFRYKKVTNITNRGYSYNERKTIIR